MADHIYLMETAKAWVKRKGKPDEVVQIILDTKNNEGILSYELYTAYEASPDYLGRILFDAQGYWIYDGEMLAIAEQEQVAKFIINYAETL